MGTVLGGAGRSREMVEQGNVTQREWMVGTGHHGEEHVEGAVSREFREHVCPGSAGVFFLCLGERMGISGA